MRIDDVLSFRPDARMPLVWSVNEHPSRAKLAPKVPRSLRAILSSPATQPPVQHLELTSELLPFRIQVNLGAAAGAMAPNAPRLRPVALPDEEEDGALAPRASYIAVEDVLAALYTALQAPLTGVERNGLTTERRRAMFNAFDGRLEVISDTFQHQLELTEGPRWVDLVAASGRTCFLGLTPTKRPNTLEVHFG
jgi:hypothetical protein